MRNSFLSISLLALGFGSLLAHPDDQNQRTREFVVMGYQGLRVELTSRPGPYVKTLHELLRTPAVLEAKTTEKLKSLLNENSNIMDFADQVILLGQKATETAQAMAQTPVPSGPGVYSGEKLATALEHLTRGMNITVTLKTGEQLKGSFAEYSGQRLWIRGAARRSAHLDDILAVEAPDL